MKFKMSMMIKSDLFLPNVCCSNKNEPLKKNPKKKLFPFFVSCFKNKIKNSFFFFSFLSLNVSQPTKIYIYICVSVCLDENLFICENQTFFIFFWNER